ncbi:MAG: peptide deformylase [Gammaproteobacteria bacterium]|nr:MAG: peptide deformylase [Gammaproteobacteria bacterium]
MAKVNNNILVYPDPRLRKKAELVDEVNDDIRETLDQMLDIMYKAPGIGLAGPQVNVHKRVVVIDVSEEKDTPLYLINPQILSSSGSEVTEEGCLSVPGISEKVKRAAEVKVRTLNYYGKEIEFDADGLLAVCIQHELDHLDGHLFIDRLSSLKRGRAKKKLEKQTN